MIREFDVEVSLKSYLREVKEEKQVFHQDKKMIPLLPFSTKFDDNIERNIKEDFKSFDGCIGHCYREIMHKALPKHLSDSKEQTNFKKNLKECILDNAVMITNCEEGQQEKLKSIIESVFFREDNLVKYGNSAQLYLFWNYQQSGLKNIADFIRELFFDDELDKLVVETTDQKKNVFHELMDRSLPKLEEVNLVDHKQDKLFHILDREIIERFRNDFKFLLTADKGTFLVESEKLLKFYFFAYISKAAFVFTDFFNRKEHQLYFTLESESVSESRRTNESGWKMLETKVWKFFSHTVTLDFINHIPLVKEMGTMDYVQLSELFKSSDVDQQQELISHARLICDEYLKYAPKDVDWLSFDEYFDDRIKLAAPENEFETIIFRLYSQIDFQFEKSSRKSKRNSYGKWFIAFSKEYILKNRGRNGYSLSLTNETLLFITKLCVAGREKMRLKDLWKQFNERGIYFDDSTQQAIIEIYDKINLIEKKSDSGDAQYIRPIL